MSSRSIWRRPPNASSPRAVDDATRGADGSPPRAPARTPLPGICGLSGKRLSSWHQSLSCRRGQTGTRARRGGPAGVSIALALLHAEAKAFAFAPWNIHELDPSRAPRHVRARATQTLPTAAAVRPTASNGATASPGSPPAPDEAERSAGASSLDSPSIPKKSPARPAAKLASTDLPESTSHAEELVTATSIGTSEAEERDEWSEHPRMPARSVDAGAPRTAPTPRARRRSANAKRCDQIRRLRGGSDTRRRRAGHQRSRQRNQAAAGPDARRWCRRTEHRGRCSPMRGPKRWRAPGRLATKRRVRSRAPGRRRSRNTTRRPAPLRSHIGRPVTMPSRTHEGPRSTHIALRTRPQPARTPPNSSARTRDTRPRFT